MLRDKLIKIIDECLDEMYRHSEPPISWKEYKERYGGLKIQGFEFHYLDGKKCEEIWDKYKKKVPIHLRTSFNMEIMNIAPTSKRRRFNAGRGIIYNGRL